MNLLRTHREVQTPPGRNPVLRSAGETRLYGRRLILAQTVWAVLVVFTLVVFVASFVVYAAHIQDICPSIPWITVCRMGQLVSGSMQLLGISVASYGIVTIALIFVWLLAWLIVAGIIIWHRSNDWMALLLSLTLILAGASTVINTTVLGAFDSKWQVANQLLAVFGNVLIFLTFSLFPNGRFVPRWIRWLIIPWIALSTGTIFFANSPLDYNSWPVPLNSIFLPLFGSLVIGQIYRYRKVSNPVERQQTKWVIFSFSVIILGYVVGAIGLDTLPTYFPALSLPAPLYQFFDVLIWNFSIILVPICFAIAILRFRLYNIDVVINRTLVYGLLTATLAVAYIGSILLLQTLSRNFTAGNALALVGSTLIIAALFHPLRRRIQRVIDRRFYRSKYDAARTLAAFAETLRAEIDLNELSERLALVVQETMQPAHVSLWLRRTGEQHGTHPAKAWISYRLTPDHKELLQPDQDSFTQPVSSTDGTEENQAALQKISRRALMIGLATTGVAVAGGSFIGLAFKYPRLYTYDGHSSWAYDVAWSPDGKRIASSSRDKTAQIWDAADGSHVFTYRGHSADVYTVAWSPNGSRIASSSKDKTVQIWDAIDGGHVFTYHGHSDQVVVVAWSPDGKRLASGGGNLDQSDKTIDTTVQVWDASDGNHVFTYRGHSGLVGGIAWSPDGKRIASASYDKSAQIWDASDGSHVFTYRGHRAEVNTIAWSHDGKYIASGSQDNIVQVWDAVVGTLLFQYTGHNGPVYGVAWSPDDKRIASSSTDTTVQVWNAADGGDVYIYRGHSDVVVTPAWSPDGRHIASASFDSTVQVWNPR